MSQEIVYTSSPQGLKLGSRGFCTVASTPGMASSLAERLESLSGYRHLYPPQDPQARLNPIAWSHLLLTVGGRRYHVLSRIADAGLDYSQRSNKLAHHVALDTNELPLGGPAWCLAHDHFMLTAWNEPPRLLNSGRVPPRGEHPAQVCTAWQRLTGDAGWAGVLAQTAETKRDAYLLFSPGMDLLPLMVEALSLLPPARRWEVSFSTYVTRLPPGVECRWRCIVADSDEAIAARRAPGATVIDLTQPLGQAPAGPLVTAARTGQITFTTAPRAGELAPLPGVRRSPLAGIDTTPDADLLSDGDYRIADDRSLPAPPPPVQLKMSTSAASSGSVRRWTLLVGSALGLLLLLGGGYVATKYLGRALASLPFKTSDSDTDAEHEQQRAAASEALQKWKDAKAAFTQETGATTLTTAVSDAVDEDAKQAAHQAKQITELAAAGNALVQKLEAYRKLETTAKELQKKEDLKAEHAKTFEATLANLLNGKKDLQAALDAAKQTVDNAQMKRDELELHRQRAEKQLECAQQLLATKQELLKQQQQLSAASTLKLDDIRSQLDASAAVCNQDFADLESWSKKLTAHRDKLKEMTEKLPKPADNKPLQESESTLAAYESLAKELAERAKKVPKPDAGEFLAKLPDNFLIDAAFPSNSVRDISEAPKHSGHLFPIPPAAEAGFKISIPNRSDIFVKRTKPGATWTVEKGGANSELRQPVGNFAISQGYLTWKWDREVNASLHEIVVKLEAGSKSRLVRLITQPPQQHAALEVAKDSEKLWRLKPSVISLATTDDVTIVVHRVDFSGLPEGFELVRGPMDRKSDELKTEVGLQRKNAKPDKPRFAVVLDFRRQPDKSTWKMRAAPLTLLVVPINDKLEPQGLSPDNYLPLVDDVLAKHVLSPESSKGILLKSMGDFHSQFENNDKAMKEAEKINDENERNKTKDQLKSERQGIEHRKKEREAVSQQVFPSDLYELVKEKPQAFIDELAGSIKIHMSIVRQVKDQPSLTIAEFGDVPTKSILQVQAAASAAASK